MNGINKILITGVPGTGKTTIGDFLEMNHDFRHINMELDEGMQLIKNSQQLVSILASQTEKIVITWGFPPNQNAVDRVRVIRDNMEFKLYWFDGDRRASRRAFNDRGTVSEHMLNEQLKGIREFNVVEKIDPILYCPFKSDGEWKSKEKIVRELMSE